MSQGQLGSPTRFLNIVAGSKLKKTTTDLLIPADFDYESEGKVSYSAGFYYESGDKMTSQNNAPASCFFFIMSRQREMHAATNFRS